MQTKRVKVGLINITRTWDARSCHVNRFTYHVPLPSLKFTPKFNIFVHLSQYKILKVKKTPQLDKRQRLEHGFGLFTMMFRYRRNFIKRNSQPNKTEMLQLKLNSTRRHVIYARPCANKDFYDDISIGVRQEHPARLYDLNELLFKRMNI